MRSVPVYFLIFSCVCVCLCSSFLPTLFYVHMPCIWNTVGFICHRLYHLGFPKYLGWFLHTEISTPWCTILWVSTKAYNHIPTATISYRAVLSIPSASLWHPWLFATPWTVAYQAPRPMGFSRQEYWMGCHFLLQGIFPTQGLNPSLLHCRQMLYCLSHQWSP